MSRSIFDIVNDLITSFYLDRDKQLKSSNENNVEQTYACGPQGHMEEYKAWRSNYIQFDTDGAFIKTYATY